MGVVKRTVSFHPSGLAYLCLPFLSLFYSFFFLHFSYPVIPTAVLDFGSCKDSEDELSFIDLFLHQGKI